jgi:beta-lactamase regulating signal transducer with metallopeptidase domain
MRPAELLAWLLTYALHGTLLLGLAALVSARRRLSPAAQDVLWKAALVGGLATATVQSLAGIAPLGGSLALSASPVTRDAGAGTLAPPVAALPATDATPAPDLAPPSAATGTPAPEPARALAPADVASDLSAAAAPPLAAETLLLILWALFAATALARLGLAHLSLRRMLGPRRPLEDDVLEAELDLLRREAGIRGELRLTTADGLVSPVALGRREICLPRAALDELDPAQQRSVLAHEVAHLARRDPTWLALATVLERLFPFQPLNRLARRRLQECAEYLCDDWAAHRAGSGIVVATSLLKVAEWMEAGTVPAPVPLAGMAESPSQLVTRVRRLVENGAPGSPDRARRFALGALVLLAGTALVAPGVTAAVVQGEGGYENAPAPFGRPSATPAPYVEAAMAPAETDYEESVRQGARPVSAPRPEPKVAPDPKPLAADTNDDARIRALVGALRDTDAGVRRAAAQSLGHLEDARAVDGLVAALGDGDAEVRVAAVQALGQIEDVRAAGPLAARLGQARGEERVAIAQALGEIEDPSSAPALARLLEDEQTEVRKAAAQALGQLDLTAAPPELIEALSDPDPEVRRSAVYAAGQMEDPRTVPVFRRILADPEADLQLQLVAVSALDDIETADAVQGLVDAMKAGSPLVRRAAAEALGQRR